MSDASHRLHQEIQAAKTLRAQLRDIIGGDEDIAADIVEGETSLNEAMEAVVAQLVDDYAAMRGLDSMLEDLGKRRERIKQRIENMRTMVSVALEQAGKKKFEHPAATFASRNVPASVVVVDEAQIPSKYFKSADPKLDRKMILEHLKNNESIPGVQLSNDGVSLAISWR